jgi:hypothetical protein
MIEAAMLEVLQFIFSSFWVFCGMIILISTSGVVISSLIREFGDLIRRRPR